MNAGKNFISIIFAVILPFACCGCINRQEFSAGKFEQNIKDVTANTKIIDANQDHNQALDVAEFAQSQGIEPPKIIINFDTHSDITLNDNIIPPQKARIDNWLDEYIAKFPQVEHLYWVMPREEDSNLYLRMFFGENKIKDLPYIAMFYGNSIKNDMRLHFLFNPLRKKSYTQEFLINPKTGNLNEYVPDPPPINSYLFDPKIKYKKIKITTCTEDTLPDFKGKEVFLSIDADYISNSGFDTYGKFTNDKTPPQIDQALYSMIKTLKDKNIRPSVIDLTLSPQYLPQDDHQQLIEFFKTMLKISGKKDALQKYTRSYND